MKKIFAILIILTLSIGSYAQRKDLTPRLDMEGVLKVEYNSYPKGTPVLIMSVISLHNQPTYNGIYLAASINNVQVPIPSDKARKLIEFRPKTKEQFWLAECLNANLFEFYDRKGYRSELRQELIEESDDYLQGLSDIYYDEAYINDYIRTIFNGIAPRKLNNKRPEQASIKIIQAPEPYTNMLSNGTLLVSTGLLSTLDSVEELTAIIAASVAHYAMDHPVNNVAKEISRARRAEFWGGFLVAVAGGVEMAIAENNEHYIPGGIFLTAAVADAALNYSATKRLGMGYTDKQRKEADRITVNFLKFANMNPTALTSALFKINQYYRQEQMAYDSDNGCFGNLTQRVSQLAKNEEFKNRSYQRTMAGVNTTNAIIQLNSRNYDAAKRLTQRNIDNKLASDEDYVVLVKAHMETENSSEANEKCLELIQEAMLLDTIPNLELYKQKILLLMRLNKQAKATEVIKEYTTLLSDFKEQCSNNEDTQWATKEIQWANKLYTQLRLF